MVDRASVREIKNVSDDGAGRDDGKRCVGILLYYYDAAGSKTKASAEQKTKRMKGKTVFFRELDGLPFTDNKKK